MRNGSRAALALAVALPLVVGAAAPATAAGGSASGVAAATTSLVAPVRAASPQPGDPVLHIGIRQAAVGEPVPVTIVGAAPGSTWEIREGASGTPLAALTVGEDGTGTALVSLPTATDAGDAALTAVGDGHELSVPLTVGSAAVGSTAARGPDPAPEQGVPMPVVLLAAGAVAGAGAAVGGVLLLRRRTRAAR